MNSIRPLKRFGQNYLKDPNILNKIVEEINPLEGDNIIEIGAGTGTLTGRIYERLKSFSAVEIDKRVTEDLKSKYPEVNFIIDDFLKIDLNGFIQNTDNKLRIAGNIPYNLTSPIIFKLIGNNTIVKDAVLMVQYEVARRMTAKQGTKDYGILSVILNFFTKTKIAFRVSANAFYPKPKVESAVVHLEFRETGKPENFNKVFIDVVKASFGNRRKMLRNSLSNSIFAKINFSESGIDLSKRAEQLSLNEFISLTEFVINSRSKYVIQP